MFLFKGRRRRKLLQTPLTAADRQLMHRMAPLTAALPPDLRPRHEGAVQVLLAEKQFEGAAGLAVSHGDASWPWPAWRPCCSCTAPPTTIRAWTRC